MERRGEKKKNFPCGPLAVWLADKQKCLQSQGTDAGIKLQKGAHTWKSHCCRCLLLFCTANAHNELATHFSSRLVLSNPPPHLPLFTHPPRLCFCLPLSLSLLPSSFSSHFLTPTLRPPPPLPSISPLLPPACFGVCAGVSRRGWRLIVARWLRRTPDTGALSRNAGMCNSIM